MREKGGQTRRNTNRERMEQITKITSNMMMSLICSNHDIHFTTQVGQPGWPWLTFLDGMKAQAKLLESTSKTIVDIVLIIPEWDVNRLARGGGSVLDWARGFWKRSPEKVSPIFQNPLAPFNTGRFLR